MDLNENSSVEMLLHLHKSKLWLHTEGMHQSSNKWRCVKFDGKLFKPPMKTNEHPSGSYKHISQRQVRACNRKWILFKSFLSVFPLMQSYFIHVRSSQCTLLIESISISYDFSISFECQYSCKHELYRICIFALSWVTKLWIGIWSESVHIKNVIFTVQFWILLTFWVHSWMKGSLNQLRWILIA